MVLPVTQYGTDDEIARPGPSPWTDEQAIATSLGDGWTGSRSQSSGSSSLLDHWVTANQSTAPCDTHAKRKSDRELLLALAELNPLHEKISALLELVERRAAPIANFVISELDARRMHPEWRRALVLAAERVRVPEPNERDALARALIWHGFILSRDMQSQRTVWAALRRVGTLASRNTAALLRPFLDAGNAKERQAALQAIRAIFSTEHEVDSEELHALRARVVALARKYLDPDTLLGGDQIALAANAFLAAKAMGAHEVDELAQRVDNLNRPALKTLIEAETA